MSVVPAQDLLRAVAGAAKLKRLWLRVAQLLNLLGLLRESTYGDAPYCFPNCERTADHVFRILVAHAGLRRKSGIYVHIV